MSKVWGNKYQLLRLQNILNCDKILVVVKYQEAYKTKMSGFAINWYKLMIFWARDYNNKSVVSEEGEQGIGSG